MVFSIEHQLEMPDSFPADAMVAFMAAARSIVLTPTKSAAWKELGGASNLIGWRFRGCYEEMHTYINSWNVHGANISFEEMYLREHALFGMCNAGVSCIESTCYALYALASHPTLLGLPFGDREQRDCSPARLKESLSKHAKARALMSTLDVLINAPEWTRWATLRNRMIHRSNLPRISYGAVGTEPPPAKALDFAATSSTSAFEGDVSDLEAMFAWLASALRNLLVEGAGLCTSP
jgi:hypothetical protein